MLKKYNYFIDAIGEKIQITDSEYEKMKNHYEALCKHIDLNHVLSNEKGNLYQQGSFLIDTVVKPLKRDEFDVDMVAEFDVEWKPQHKVNEFYDKLYDSFDTKLYGDKLEKYRNSIRINYKGNYHFDIMPVIKTCTKDVFKAPDVKMSKWVDRAPKSYSEWFNEKCDLIMLNEGYILDNKAYFNTNIRDMNIDELKKPLSFRMKAPLKRAVQLIKRARDVFFQGVDEYIPQSIVLTTLVANCYEGETEIVGFLKKVANSLKMLAMQEEVFNLFNPIKNANENFTEKWQFHDEYFDNFKKFAFWFDYKVKNLESENIIILEKTCRSLFGEDYSSIIGESDLLWNFDQQLRNKNKELFKQEKLIEDLFELDLKYNVEIDCKVTQNGFREKLLSAMRILKKEKNLKFFIKNINVPGEYKCCWKVRNLGDVAERRECIRGNIDLKRSEREMVEKSNFIGPHFVECYIIKNNKVVAVNRINVKIENQ